MDYFGKIIVGIVLVAAMAVLVIVAGDVIRETSYKKAAPSQEGCPEVVQAPATNP